MIDYRCTQCHALLFKADLVAGHVEIKCPKCNCLNNFIAPPRAVSVNNNLMIDFFGGASADEHQPIAERQERQTVTSEERTNE